MGADSTLASCAVSYTTTATDAAAHSTDQAGSAMVDRDLLDDYNVRLDGRGTGGGIWLVTADAGDVNGDGLSDVVVGSRASSGAWVVFGQASPADVNLADLGGSGFRIQSAIGELTGAAVAGASDVNGDGTPDQLVGAPLADTGGRASSGSAYVLFGKATSSAIDLRSLGAGGWALDGAAAGGQAGYSVAGAGDLDGDGRPDQLTGAPYADPGGVADVGTAYILKGPTCS